MAQETAVAAGRIGIDGELTIYQAGLFAGLLHQVRTHAAAGGSLAFDLERVTELDGAGVQMLLVLFAEAERLGLRAVLAQRSEAVARVLETLQLRLPTPPEGAR